MAGSVIMMQSPANGLSSKMRCTWHRFVVAYRFIAASYRSTDRRELDEQGGLPGVTREYHATVARGKWGAFDYANAGIEGYGWGALSIHLLMRYILGLRAEEVDRLTVRPVLPQALCRLGAT